MKEVINDMPPDPTDLEDTIQSHLFGGCPKQALQPAYRFDIWFSAHLADVLESLQLLELEILE